MKKQDNITKRMYFLKYFGQNVFSDGENHNIKVDNDSVKKDYHLVLRPISSLTENEAKQILRVFDSNHFDYSFFDLIYELLKCVSYYNNKKFTTVFTSDDIEDDLYEMFSKLARFGIAIPAYDLTVNDIIELGWIKLKEQ